MKKTTLSLTVVSLIGMLSFFSSCKKESSKAAVLNQDLITKVNSWLDKQKVSFQPNKVANIELLKTNLDFANLSIETSDGNEQIVIVPINEKFKGMKGIDQNAIPDLVVILDKYGSEQEFGEAQ